MSNTDFQENSTVLCERSDNLVEDNANEINNQSFLDIQGNDVSSNDPSSDAVLKSEPIFSGAISCFTDLNIRTNIETASVNLKFSEKSDENEAQKKDMFCNLELQSLKKNLKIADLSNDINSSHMCDVNIKQNESPVSNIFEENVIKSSSIEDEGIEVCQLHHLNHKNLHYLKSTFTEEIMDITIDEGTEIPKDKMNSTEIQLKQTSKMENNSCKIDENDRENICSDNNPTAYETPPHNDKSILNEEHNSILPPNGTDKPADKEIDQIITVKIKKFLPIRKWDSIPNLRENDIKENGNNFPLGNLKPIYRLSLRLSSANRDLPHADSFGEYEKAGYLLKQCGRGFPYYIHQWKRRYCILKEGRLFIYEREDSKGSEKTSSVIDLKYFDHVAETAQKESKKASNIFVVTSQDRSFFDPGRHLFAADTLSNMHEWISKLRESIELIRNNNRTPLKKGGKLHPREDNDQTCNSSDQKQQQRRSSNDLIQELSRKSRRGSKRDEDIVDSILKRKEERMEEDLATSSEKKKRKEIKSEIGKSVQDQYTEEVEPAEPSDLERHPKAVVKLSTTKKISLQAPTSDHEFKRMDSDIETKRLESITKNRNKGPTGRRAPQHRRATFMKHRASSMSALQHGADEDIMAREEKEINRSTEVAESNYSNVLNTSQPVLAYHYSSDEESPIEDNVDPEGYFGMLASAVHPQRTPPSPPLRPPMYNIEVVPHHPVEGLHVYIPTVGYQPLHERKAPLPLQNCVRGDPEYRSLPRALGRGSSCGTLGGVETSGSLKMSKKERGSVSRISSGRASPEMDALDNMLMNESIRPSSVNKDENSDHESSDGSTCKMTEPRRYNQLATTSSKHRFTEDELSKALENFSSALQHLQHHTAELECRTKSIENENIISKKDVSNLKKSSDGFRNDLERLTETVTFVSQEASKVKMDVLSQQKETEKVQKAAATALSEARKSQFEYEKAKDNYESLIQELHSLISSIRTSLIVAEPTENVELRSQKKLVSEESIEKLHKDREKRENEGGMKQGTASTETKKNSSVKENGSPKPSGYQSFFQRPSSLIHSITNRSGNKSSNVGKTKKVEGEKGKQEMEKKTKTHKPVNSEKKAKVEKASQSSLERKTKSSKKDAKNDKEIDDVNKLNKRKSKSIDEPKESSRGDTGKTVPNIHLEDFPMMDEPIENMDKKLNCAVGLSHISINVSPPPHNYHLEKSLSSPSVITKFSHSKLNRPNVLNIKPNNADTFRSSSNTSSPDSPIISSIPYSFGSVGGLSSSSKESKYIYESSLFPTQPPVTKPSLGRAIPEDRVISSSRPGVFAISRQSSSPNIPLQRQSSAPLYPLQRQHSLGTVPEEGQLPRQASLMSVPEDRPITDQTLPLSPSSSMVSFPLSHTPSGGSELDNLRERTTRNSMELVTGPVVSGSVIQETFIRQLPPASEFEGSEAPMATSSLKKVSERKKNSKKGIVV